MIKGFSRTSRRNCINSLNQIDKTRVLSTWFLTLTAPLGAMTWADVERMRRNWFKRLRRRFPGQWFAFWKKEVHDGKGPKADAREPHLHCLLFWLEPSPDLDGFKAWNDVAWADVVGAEGEAKENNRRFGCRVEVMRGWNGVKAYTAKYLGKDQVGLLGETGRIWGIERRELMPVELTESEAQADEGHRIKRCLRKHQQRSREAWYVWDDGGWRRIRSSKFDGSVHDQVQRLKLFGARLKRRRPRLCHTVSVPVWVEERIDRGNGKIIVQMVREDDELHSFSPSRHFIDHETVVRLVMFFQGRCAADRRVVSQLPF